MEWGPDAFRKAILRDRPILLNVVVPWSRLCHEMESTWGNPKVAALVNDAFVPVLVDAEKRPDLRERYSLASWPAVTLLLPNGVPFYAAREGADHPTRVAFGAIAPEKLFSILEEARTLFADKSQRPAMKKTVEEGQKADAEPKPESSPLDREAPEKILRALRTNFDEVNGGWIKAPKFPMSVPIDACLLAYSREGDARFLDIAERALHAVTEGPLFDRVDGGVHRLSAAEDWSRPEYEKLLDRNVALLDNLLSAFLLTSKQEYADRSSDVIRFLDGTLRRPVGGYSASQAADFTSPDGGAYYRLPARDRQKRAAPPVDDLVLTGWSAKAAAAELKAAYLLRRPELARSARQTLDWLLGNVWERGRGVVRGIEGNTKVLPAYLEDQVLFAEGMMDAYQLTGQKTYLNASKDVVEFVIANLRDADSGRFGDIIPNPADPAVPLRTALHPYEANCRMARLLAILLYLNPEERTFGKTARAILERYTDSADRGPGSALYAIALTEYLEGPTFVFLVGNSSIPGTPQLMGAVHQLPVLWKIVVTLDPAVARDLEAVKTLGLVSVSPPAVYITIGTHTSRASLTAEQVMQNYRTLASRAAAERAKEKPEEGGKSSKGSERPSAPVEGSSGAPSRPPKGSDR